MLGQLVCIDRRYQRMNCFNVREVQALLKRKFFHDLVISSDYHTLLNNAILNVRYKTSNISILDSNSHLLNKAGINYTPSTRFMDFTNPNLNSFINYIPYTNTITTYILDFFTKVNFINQFQNLLIQTSNTQNRLGFMLDTRYFK